MSTITITITKKGLRENSKLVSTIADWAKRYVQLEYPDSKDDIEVDVEMYEPPESRADRLDQAAGLVENAKQIVDDLTEELQNWHDNLPENMQNGEKANQLDEAIGALESLSSDLEGIDFSGVEFPSMMG